MKTTRRDFLTTAAIAATGMTMAFDLGAAEATGPKLGLTTYQIADKWDIDKIIANLTKLDIRGVELRTDMKYRHGVELTLDSARRAEVRKRFADSPITLVGIACSERFDDPDPAKVAAAIEKSKRYLQLCADLGSEGLRVFPNSFHKNVPKDKTIEQIIEALKKLTQTAADLNQQVCLEAHGPVGLLPNICKIVKAVDHKNVRAMLNSDMRDLEEPGLRANLESLRGLLAGRAHIHELTAQKYIDARFYETQYKFLKQEGWNGWCLLEIGGNKSKDDEDRMAILRAMRARWDEIKQA